MVRVKNEKKRSNKSGDVYSLHVRMYVSRARAHVSVEAS